jgi:DNA-binding HxlR family transcriptional regulator
MASPIGYQPFCPVGAALNVVGERWALLIVRDLMLGPRRYTELLHGLGGVSTDILAARLRGLEETGIVRQTGDGRARSYELTDSGKALRPVLVELARWGAARLQLPADPSQIPPRVPLSSLLIGAPPLPRKANGVYELRVADDVVRAEVAHGQVTPCPERQPSTTIILSMAGLRSLILGEALAAIQESGDVTIAGDTRAAEALLTALSRPPLLEGLRPQLIG